MLLWFAFFGPHQPDANEPFFPQSHPAKGTRKIAEKGRVATANFSPGKGIRTPSNTIDFGS
jgi:hypothetical protein